MSSKAPTYAELASELARLHDAREAVIEQALDTLEEIHNYRSALKPSLARQAKELLAARNVVSPKNGSPSPSKTELCPNTHHV